MNIDSIKNGIVLDHITAGKGMDIYYQLGLDKLERAYYAGLKGEMEHNLQLKTELCEAAEALRDSEEWKIGRAHV